MTEFLFPAPACPSLPVTGHRAHYPVARIFCVGRNYAAHAAEMGGEVDREAPWYFTKSAHALCQTGQTRPYPPGTQNFHHEMELVVALGGPAFQVDKSRAMDAVFGYACGLDMTRRDRQQDGKDARRPWSLGKDIENGAVIAALTQKSDFAPIDAQRISLKVNGTLRQDAQLSDMVWTVAEIIIHLSQFYHLDAGDLIMTGTPAGVGAVVSGDVITGEIEGLNCVTHQLSDAQ